MFKGYAPCLALYEDDGLAVAKLPCHRSSLRFDEVILPSDGVVAKLRSDGVDLVEVGRCD